MRKAALVREVRARRSNIAGARARPSSARGSISNSPSDTPDPLAYGKAHTAVTGREGQAVQREAVNAGPLHDRDLTSPVDGFENVRLGRGAVDDDASAGTWTRVVDGDERRTAPCEELRISSWRPYECAVRLTRRIEVLEASDVEVAAFATSQDLQADAVRAKTRRPTPRAPRSIAIRAPSRWSAASAPARSRPSRDCSPNHDRTPSTSPPISPLASTPTTNQTSTHYRPLTAAA